MANSNTYDVGDKVTLSVNIKLDGSDTDPSGLTFRHKTPDGQIQDFVFGQDSALVKDSTGNYHIDIVLSNVGRHFYRWVATGTAHGAAEKRFDVRRTEFD